MKKRWLFAPVAVAVLAIGVLSAGAVLAQESDTEGDSIAGSLASRVARILGIEDETVVQDAIEQARQEMRDEAIQSKLNAMVEQGRLSRDQADEYLLWYQDMPEGLNGFGFGRHGRGFGHGGMKGMRGFRGFQQMPPAESPSSADATTF